MTTAKIKAPTSYKRTKTGVDWSQYEPGDFFDETISSPGNARAVARSLVSHVERNSMKKLQSMQQAANLEV